jgi:4-hydroxythreonine-4-phosphate dehydrogenase
MSKYADTARLAITPGEPAGIGPDILIQLAQEAPAHPWLVFACPRLLESRACELGLPLNICLCEDPEQSLSQEAGTLSVWPVQTKQKVRSGQLCKDNAPYVLACLDQAVALCLKDPRYGLLTGPVHKGHLTHSGLVFHGHTEYLAKLCKSTDTVMLLANEHLRVALATTHLPLAQVPGAINEDMLTCCVVILRNFLRRELQIENPLIAVLGLNPHAGDDGALGKEESEIITPCLEKLRAEGMRLLGPLSADTAFIREEVRQADAVLAMYHDQGLPVLKYAGFGKTVNITLGLPIVRVSVDHGTALELAGTGKAQAESMHAAVHMATQLIGTRTHASSVY